MKPLAHQSRHPHPAIRWWAAVVAAVVLLLASAGAIAHYVLNWL